jgi:hypothetical protein
MVSNGTLSMMRSVYFFENFLGKKICSDLSLQSSDGVKLKDTSFEITGLVITKVEFEP